MKLSDIVSYGEKKLVGFHLQCPGCNTVHTIFVAGNEKPRWDWNGDREKPTFSPSILVQQDWGPNHEQRICHSFVRDGQWQFLGDCTHELKGKTVDMVDVPEDYW